MRRLKSESERLFLSITGREGLVFSTSPRPANVILAIKWIAQKDSRKVWRKTVEFSREELLPSRMILSDGKESATVGLSWGAERLVVNSYERVSDPYLALATPLSLWLAVQHATVTLRCSATVDANRKALLWFGQSGSGKSTAAELDSHRRMSRPLGDDHIIITTTEAGVRMGPAPWDNRSPQPTVLLRGIQIKKITPEHKIVALGRDEVLYTFLQHAVGFAINNSVSRAIIDELAPLVAHVQSNEGE